MKLAAIVAVFLVAVLAVAALFSWRQKAKFAATKDTHDLRQQVEKMATAYAKQRSNVALTIGVLQKGKTHFLGFGSIRPGTNLPPDDKTLYEIGSVTKIFTTTLLARLVAENRVKLDDPVSKYLPKNLPLAPKLQAVTLAHLATHTAGMPRLPHNFRITFENAKDPYCNYTTTNLYEELATIDLDGVPGARSRYSNLGVGLLGHLLGLAAGQPYKTLVTEQICVPLALHDTVFAPDADQSRRLVRGYDHTGNLTPPWTFDVMAPAGALHSTASDLLLFLQANLKPPEGPLGEGLKSAQTVYVQNWNGQVALGWQVLAGLEGLQYHWHNGGTGGFVSFCGFDLQSQTAVVLLSNYGDAMSGRIPTDSMGLEILRLAAKISWE